MTDDSTRDAKVVSPAPSWQLADPWFRGASTWIVVGGVVLGTLRACIAVAAGSNAQTLSVAVVLDAAYLAVLHVMAGILAAAPVRALGDWLIRPLVGPSSVQSPAHITPEVDDLAVASVEIRRLIRQEDWDAVDERIADLTVRRKDDATVQRLVAELSQAKQNAVDHWRNRILAARQADDAGGVLEIYEAAPPGVDTEIRREIDLELAKWFLALIHRRLRSGVLQIDIVVLVDRASTAFAHTKEGASLRAALPTLRRGAGLCARCGKPYSGHGDACPECLGGPPPPPPYIPELEPMEEELEPVADRADSEWFIDAEEEDGPRASA